jgi:membrane protein implicated in regulation of membrane protease activity
MAWILWVAVALVLGVVEVMIVDLVFLMFAGGALAAALAGGLGAPLWVQVVVFCFVSAVLLVAVRPWALRTFKKSVPELATNVAAHVGRTAVVLIDVTPHAGRVKLAGEVWTARAAAQQAVLPVGSLVRVVRIDGATAVVEPVPAADPAPRD